MISNKFRLILIVLVLYFDRIPLWGKFITTFLVGLLIGLFVMFIVKPRMKKKIEGWRTFDFLISKRKVCFLFLVALRKKRDLDSRADEPQLTKTEGRFETYTGKENFYLKMFFFTNIFMIIFNMKSEEMIV